MAEAHTTATQAPELEEAFDVENTAIEETAEAPRPALTLQQAAAILGKSLRSLERSILGRWGNKLPEGWSARQVDLDGRNEWRIIPPANFRLRSSSSEEPKTSFIEDVGDELIRKLFADRRKSALPQTLISDNPTIVIDRSDDVERLLRELLQTQKQLSEERRLRMEDLRLITQMQGSMRLLEDRASQTALLKAELDTARLEMTQLKQQYEELAKLPWYKRIFRGTP